MMIGEVGPSDGAWRNILVALNRDEIRRLALGEHLQVECDQLAVTVAAITGEDEALLSILAGVAGAPGVQVSVHDDRPGAGN